MQRLSSAPRAGWLQTIEQQGLIFWPADLPDGTQISYWNEEAYYALTAAEVDQLEAAAAGLMDLLVEAGDAIVSRNLFGRMGIPGWAEARIRETWESEPPMLYGRFDFAFGPDGPKMLEYNADTPTALLETAVQWHWAQDVFGESVDQWNRVHEALVARWRELLTTGRLPGDRLHMVFSEQEKSGEDFATVGYLAETAAEAGITVEVLPIEQVGLDRIYGFLDLANRPMRTVFKLYPWEWLVAEQFGMPAIARMGVGTGETTWIEPIWKMMWSNKGILPVLWELFPDHPNLLPAYFESDKHLLRDYVRKPLLAREGANATVVRGGTVVESGPDEGYGTEGYVVQQYTDLGTYDGWSPVLGIWTVDMEPVGCGVREQTGLITNNTSRFTPHIIRG